MRAMLTLAASLFVCAGLFGCDDDGDGHKTTASVIGAAAASPGCKCKQAAQGEPDARAPSPLRHRYHHRFRHYAHFAHKAGSGHSWYEIGWGSSAGSTGSYSDSSRNEYAMAEQAPDDMPPPPPLSAPYPPPPPPGAGPGGPPMDSGVWVDGYGRGHYADGEAPPSPNDNTEYLSNEDAGRRHDPWRGFNAKCRNTVE
jgi:hypothetical protein